MRFPFPFDHPHFMEQLLIYLRTFASDRRLEVVLADLVAYGVSLEDVRIQPIGLGRRRFDRDIAKIKYESSLDSGWSITIFVNREGIYDALPQGVFHQPSGRKTARSKKEVLEEMKAQRKKESAARAFFLPLEQEFFRARVGIETKERAFLPFHDQEFAPAWFSEDFWHLPPCLNDRQQMLARYLLPLAAQISANLSLAEVCLSNFLGESVWIQRLGPLEENLIDTSGLAEVALGIDFVLGGLISDGLPSTNVCITPVSTHSLQYYFSDPGKSLLDFLSNAFLPLESPPIFTFDTQYLEMDFLLAEEDSALLGYTTYLG
jgi:type VI secretion system protein ImpH